MKINSISNTIDYSKYQIVEIARNVMQDWRSYTVKTTAEELKALEWKVREVNGEKRIYAEDENGRMEFRIVRQGRGIRALLHLEGDCKEANHSCYNIYVSDSEEHMDKGSNPSIVAMWLPHQVSEGKQWLRDWNLTGKSDRFDNAYWGIEKTLGWIEYITGKEIA